MKPDIKLIATDMDGTLLDADHVTVPERNIKALRAASERGVAIAIASGRTWSLIADAVEQLGLMDYAVISNGAAVRDIRHHHRIYEHSIPNAQALALIDVLHRRRIPFEFYCGGQGMVEIPHKNAVRDASITPAFAELFLKTTQFISNSERSLTGRPVEKFNLFNVAPEEMEVVKTALEAVCPLSFTSSLMGNAEFMAGDVSKGSGLAALAGYMGIGPEHVMALGDATNDLEMLEWADWSFAMENGCDEAKAAAKFRTAANRDSGVGQAVERYVLG